MNSWWLNFVVAGLLPPTVKLGFPNPVTSCALDVETDVLNEIYPSFERARTIEIWADVLFVGRIWDCVKTEWIAIVRLLPLARSDLNELFNALSTWTCEHSKCRLETT